MLRLGIVLISIAAPLWCQEFTFTLGNPVAAQDFQVKGAAFIFRTEGCPDAEKPEVSGTVEGIVSGDRRSVKATIITTSKLGVYAIPRSWPAEGKWVVVLKGTCGKQTAGALVPMGASGFVREAAKLFPRTVTSADIDASLKALTQGEIK